MTYNFKKTPSRVETKTLDVVDANGDEVGKFTVKPQDVNSPLWLKRLLDAKNRLSPADRRRVDNPKSVADIEYARSVTIKNFCEFYLVDAEIKDEDDNLIPFSKEMAVAFFTQDPTHYGYFREVDDASANLDNFRKEAVEDAKND